jgi:RNA polymerase sigma factor (sigma-70 family)
MYEIDLRRLTVTCTDAELVDKVCQGDIDAFGTLINKYANAVYGTAFSKLNDFHTAQDIAQEVFVKIFQKLSYLKKPDKLGSWLYAVTTRECIDWLRSNKKNEVYGSVETFDVPQLETTEDKLLKKEVRNNVWNALNTLSEANRIVTILYYIDDYKIKEIGDFLGISADAVESRLRRSRTLLKKELLSVVNENLGKNKLNDEFKKRIFLDERMPESKFRSVVMGESEFDDIDMHKTNFNNINMQGVKFDNIDMSRTIFHDINMQGVKFDEVGMWEIEISNGSMGGAYIHDIILEGKGNKFESCELNGTSFINCNLSDVDIKDCNITGLKVNGISLDILLENYNKDGK